MIWLLYNGFYCFVKIKIYFKSIDNFKKEFLLSPPPKLHWHRVACTKKEYFGGFHHIDLKEYLLSKQIDTVIVVGMMIHNCINATTYSSTDEGFKSIVVAEAVNTMDQQIFGEMIPAETIWEELLGRYRFCLC